MIIVDTGDPAEDLVRLGLAYRSSALENPCLHPVMFGQPPLGMERILRASVSGWRNRG